MAKEFLSDGQKKELESKNWEVKPKGFFLTFYKDEHNHGNWKQMCKIAGVSSSVSELKVLCFGSIAK